MNALYAQRNNPTSGLLFPKSARLLRPTEFRKVYDQGWRYTCPLFSAFCLHESSDDAAKFGFTLPRAVGKANLRNRIRRRIREIVRLRRNRFPVGYSIVFNPRRAAYDAPSERLCTEVERLIERCNRP